MKILITGATSGIGRQVAIDYHKLGHEVWAVGRNAQALEELSSLGLRTGQVDLTDSAATLAWFSTLDSIDLAILNAGTCEYVDMPRFDSALVIRVMRANVESLAICLEGVLPLLRKSNAAHLAVVGSSAAYVPLPRAEAYGSSKAAVAYMVETLRIALAKEKITVSLICPGFVKTPLVEKQIPEQAKELNMSEEDVIKKIMLKDTVDGEFTSLKDLADCAVFLAGFDGLALTGQSFIVSHGWYME